ncbi:MAG: HD domain-containing protein [Bacillus sp. (in: firmicutes)]
MHIIDEIYGEYFVEPVLKELIESAAVQRLKNIHQGGANYLVNKEWNGTRYEHSIGVMLLIRRLGGTIEEQIAGLLHDVSHTAFSHVIDYVLDEKEEDYHEKIFVRVIENSDIPIILKKYDFNYKDILFDLSRWTLLEQPLPDLCADRIDYTLRDLYTCGEISSQEISVFLSCLIVHNHKICIDCVEKAEWFVDIYYKEVIDFFQNPLSIYGAAILSEALIIALDHHILKPDDFLGTDEDIINHLYASDHKPVVALLNKLQEEVTLISDKKDYDYHMKQKERLIDPIVLVEKLPAKASLLSEKVRSKNAQASEKLKKGVYIRVI